MMMDKDKGVKKKSKSGHILIWLIFLEVVIVVAGIGYILLPKEDKELEALLDQDVSIDYIEETETEMGNPVPKPEVDEQFLTINEYSRPGDKTDGIKYIVIHYLANPKTTAQQNHDYFESLKDLQNMSRSANYVIGLEGEIIQCVPDDEIAYASNNENHESISIENCHKDDSGKFTEATYDSLVRLTAYLTEEYGLDRDQIIRHYDITGKECPKYYVEHEDKWEEFKDDVMNYREQCREEALAVIAAEKAKRESEVDLLAVYLESNARDETDSETENQ